MPIMAANPVFPYGTELNHDRHSNVPSLPRIVSVSSVTATSSVQWGARIVRSLGREVDVQAIRTGGISRGSVAPVGGGPGLIVYR